MTCAFAGIAVTLLASPSVAADLSAGAPTKAARPAVDWSGFYVGAHVGYGGGSLGPGSNALPEQAVFFPPSITGLIGGLQAGYLRQLPNHMVLGTEADISFGSPVDEARLTPAPFNTSVDYVATARGRIGYAFGALMPYVTGGFAWGRTQVGINDAAGDVIGKKALLHPGWTAGLGAEFAVGGNWTARAEYDYIALASRTYDLGSAGLPSIGVAPGIHAIKLGLSYHFWDTPNADGSTAPAARAGLPQSTDWNVHAQSTLIGTGYPPIHSPYAGPDSLPGGGQGRETWTATAFMGWRLWQGGEFYFDPEVAQGLGLNGTLGIAGFPNGEAQKAGADFPKFRAQRYYLKQTFGLGGEQEDVADGPNQLASKRDIDRVTLILGRFAVGDFFDGNSYAKDPRADFMNWAIWASAAYDFPADLPGYTRGGIIELNRKDWALRAGVFEVPAAPNSDVLTFDTAGTVIELEERYAIAGHPGKLRLGAFANRGDTANYRDVLAAAAADPTVNINTLVPGLRQNSWKYGFYANAEQQIAKDVGLFARASWNDGQTEILSFTDIDRSLSGGVSIKGSSWGRADDTIGIAGAVNGLSGAHRDFLAAGGLGLLIGDGQLNYRPESIFEAYYAYAIDKTFTVTADYQFIANPAYNADRGPASVFSARLHGEF